MHTLSTLERDLRKLQKLQKFNNYHFGTEDNNNNNNNKKSMWSKIKKNKGLILGLGLGTALAGDYVMRNHINKKPVLPDNTGKIGGPSKADKTVDFLTTRNHQGNGLFSSMLPDYSLF